MFHFVWAGSDSHFSLVHPQTRKKGIRIPTLIHEFTAIGDSDIMLRARNCQDSSLAIHKLAELGRVYFPCAFSLSSTPLSSSSFFPASPSLPAAVRCW